MKIEKDKLTSVKFVPVLVFPPPDFLNRLLLVINSLTVYADNKQTMNT